MKANHTNIASSRPLGVAKSLGAPVLDEATIFARDVILTGEQAALETNNGRWCLLNSLRLLSRVVGPLTVVLPHGMDELQKEVRQLAGKVWSRGTVTVVNEVPPVALRNATAILSIGSAVHPHLPWTTINANGWVARVSSETGALPTDTGQSNPLAAMMAASLGVTEVFKRVYGIPHENSPLLEATQFSLFELSTSPSGVGPPLPPMLSLPDTVVVGAGAIGNGIALLLSQLSVRGRVHIIDKQDYADENLGTCVVLDDKSWLGESKAECLASWLNNDGGLRCSGEQALVADARSRAPITEMSVDLVLNGLDDVQARHDAQLLWPSVLVDGGINAVGVAVVTHRLDCPHGACMRCSFRLPVFDKRLLQARSTGLSHASLDSDHGRQLNELDVTQAEESQRSWLRDQVAKGKTVCATITDAKSRLLGLNLENGFSPSVPFVATASAALVVAQALKALAYPNAEFTQRFQIESFFIGPDASVGVLTPADPGCICVAQRTIIDQVAAMRSRSRAGARTE